MHECWENNRALAGEALNTRSRRRDGPLRGRNTSPAFTYIPGRAEPSVHSDQSLADLLRLSSSKDHANIP